MSDVIYLNNRTSSSNSGTATSGEARMHVGQGAIAPAVSAEVIARAMTMRGSDSDHPPVLDMPRIVALVLRSARRFGRKPSSVPKFVTADLERHCALGDPTALLMRDWIADSCTTLQDVPAPVVAADRGRAGEG